ncbi:MAG: hypothetical protein R3C11_21675 [Planctomycetaceae bacterium]
MKMSNVFSLSAAVVVLLILAGGFAALIAYTVQTHNATAAKYEYLVRAICEYRAETGMLPYQLDDLVPEYIEAVPPDHSVDYSPARLSIKTYNVLNDDIAYDFDMETSRNDTGWTHRYSRAVQPPANEKARGGSTISD